MLRRVILTEQAHKQAAAHLLAHYDENGRGDEDLCFALWRPSTGESVKTAVVAEIILPRPGDRNVHGNVSFEPQFLQRAVNRAYNEKAGLVFMHSHPCDNWQGMSRDDVVAEQRVIAPRTPPLGLPLVGMTIGTNEAWSARFWEMENGAPKKRECDRVNVVGGHISATFHPRMVPQYEFRNELRRTVSVWGKHAQSTLGRLRFGVVGLGSVGSQIAESLARMGVRHITLIDPDAIEPHNLDRLIYATNENIKEPRELKVNFFAKCLRKSATAKKEQFTVRPVPYGVDQHPGFKAALDCDILFGCVDTHTGRLMLNHIAYAHAIPVFEGGIIAIPEHGKIGKPRWKTHAVYPGARCLRCYKQYNSVGLDDESIGEHHTTYSGTWDKKKPAPNQNVYVFSAHLASTQVLQMLRHVVAPTWPVMRYTHFHYRTYDFDMEEPFGLPGCNPKCKFPGIVGRGDECTDHLTQSEPESQPAAKESPVGFWRRILGLIRQRGD